MPFYSISHTYIHKRARARKHNHTITQLYTTYTKKIHLFSHFFCLYEKKVVTLQPNLRHQHIGSASASQAEEAGSIPVCRSSSECACRMNDACQRPWGDSDSSSYLEPTRLSVGQKDEKQASIEEWKMRLSHERRSIAKYKQCVGLSRDIGRKTNGFNPLSRGKSGQQRAPQRLMAVRQQCLVPAKATNNPQGGSDTSILWAAIPSIPVPERCSRKLEGRKQQKRVAIHCSRLMIDTIWNF